MFGRNESQPQTQPEAPSAGTASTPFWEKTFTRRQVGKAGVAFLGGVALGVTNPFPIPGFSRPAEVKAEAFDGGDPSVELNGGSTTEKPILTGFAEMSFEQQCEAVATNIKLFKKLSPEELQGVGERYKLRCEVNPGVIKPAPIFFPNGIDSNDVPHYLANSSDANEYFPNVALLDVPVKGYTPGEEFDGLYDPEQKDHFGIEVNVQAFYLGRTKHKADLSIGEVDNHIAYFGMYIDDLPVVIPVWLGWETDDDISSDRASLLVGEKDAPPVATPIVETGPITPLAEVIDEIDRHEAGAALFRLQLNIRMAIPNEDVANVIIQGQTERGRPTDFNTVKKWQERADALLGYYETLEALTLSRAKKKKFSLYTQAANHDPVPVPITAPELTDEQEAEALKTLPRPGNFLNKEKVSVNKLNVTPNAVVVEIYPTDKTIFESLLAA